MNTKKQEEQRRYSIKIGSLYEEIDRVREDGYKMDIVEAAVFYLRWPFRLVAWAYRARRNRHRCWHCKKKAPGYGYVGNGEFFPYCSLACVKAATKVLFTL